MWRSESDPAWLERLAELNAVIAGTERPLVGNLFYDHLQLDFAVSPPNPILKPKRDRFRQAIEGRTKLLEIGVNGGHSTFLALTSDPAIEVHGVDICEHPYVRPAADWLRHEFPGRMVLHEGDSRQVLPRLARAGWVFDAFHIDGAKSAYPQDIRNCRRMVEGEAVIIVDDMQLDEVAETIRRCLEQGITTSLAEFPSMPSDIKYRNEIMMLVPSTVWSTLGSKALAPARGVRRRLEGNGMLSLVAVRIRGQVRRTSSLARDLIQLARRRSQRMDVSKARHRRGADA